MSACFVFWLMLDCLICVQSFIRIGRSGWKSFHKVWNKQTYAKCNRLEITSSINKTAFKQKKQTRQFQPKIQKPTSELEKHAPIPFSHRKNKTRSLLGAPEKSISSLYHPLCIWVVYSLNLLSFGALSTNLGPFENKVEIGDLVD